MRIAPAAAAAALALLFTLAASGTASAAPCTFPASAYSTGAPSNVENVGPRPVNDPIFPNQWGVRMVKAPAAWARGARGAGVTIAVLDTGVDLGHPDLRAKLVPGVDVTPPDKQSCAGPQDENGHGTHVAGIAGASTNNRIGVAGTAPAAKIMPVRVLDDEGSADDPTVIKGIRAAADRRAKIINLSLGGNPIIGEAPQFNAEIAKAVSYAYSKGSLVVAAAGNESIPLCSYPAAASKAVCVGAVDRRGVPATYSNFPASMEDAVGVRAPGGVGDQLFCESNEDIWSTVSPHGDNCSDTSDGFLAGYETFAGTSMAAPFVAGVAAILSGRGLTNAQILKCLKLTSSGGGSYDPVMGYGIVDADAATRRCAGSRKPTTPAKKNRVKLRVSHRRISARRLARARKMRVTVRASRAVTVRLRAFAHRTGKKPRPLGQKRARMTKSGKRTFSVRIGKRSARWLRKHRKASVRVRFTGGGRKGTAKVR